MDHLSGLDASFLYLETPETPMHVGGLNILELPPGYSGNFVDDVRRHIESRLHLASVFQRKLVNMPFDLANPVWVAEDDIDLEYHIRSTVLPAPGNRSQLERLVGRLHSSLLDRSRPLWEFYVIEGLATPEGSPAGTRHVAFYSKVHHAALDGMGGIALANAILDITPEPRAVKPAKVRRHDLDTYGVAELGLAGARNTLSQVSKLVRSVPRAARLALQAWRAREELAGDGDSSAQGWFAPRTPLNVNITNQRSFASLSLPLKEIKAIGQANGATINDVVLAICSGALRDYLADHGCVPESPLLAAVPISLREEGNTDLNNQASMIRISLASTIADPLARLAGIVEASRRAKLLAGRFKSVIPTDFPSLGAPWLLSGAAALFGRSRIANRMAPLANVAISNVPGPKFPLYLCGARMLTYYPVSIAVHTMALNITVQSYNGSLDFGLTACRKAMPDPADLAAQMRAAHKALLRLSMPAAIADATPPIPAPPQAQAPARPTKVARNASSHSRRRRDSLAHIKNNS